MDPGQFLTLPEGKFTYEIEGTCIVNISIKGSFSLPRSIPGSPPKSFFKPENSISTDISKNNWGFDTVNLGLIPQSLNIRITFLVKNALRIFKEKVSCF